MTYNCENVASTLWVSRPLLSRPTCLGKVRAWFWIPRASEGSKRTGALVPCPLPLRRLFRAGERFPTEDWAASGQGSLPSVAVCLEWKSITFFQHPDSSFLICLDVLSPASICWDRVLCEQSGFLFTELAAQANRSDLSSN